MEEIIRLQFLLQSVLHKIEDIDESVVFKRELKQRSNSYYAYIDKFVESITKQMGRTESDSHVDIVNSIDNIVNDINIHNGV